LIVTCSEPVDATYVPLAVAVEFALTVTVWFEGVFQPLTVLNETV
jgi:hypothetical protein